MSQNPAGCTRWYDPFVTILISLIQDSVVQCVIPMFRHFIFLFKRTQRFPVLLFLEDVALWVQMPTSNSDDFVVIVCNFQELSGMVFEKSVALAVEVPLSSADRFGLVGDRPACWYGVRHEVVSQLKSACMGDEIVKVFQSRWEQGERHARQSSL